MAVKESGSRHSTVARATPSAGGSTSSGRSSGSHDIHQRGGVGASVGSSPPSRSTTSSGTHSTQQQHRDGFEGVSSSRHGTFTGHAGTGLKPVTRPTTQVVGGTQHSATANQPSQTANQAALRPGQPLDKLLGPNNPAGQFPMTQTTVTLKPLTVTVFGKQIQISPEGKMPCNEYGPMTREQAMAIANKYPTDARNTLSNQDVNRSFNDGNGNLHRVAVVERDGKYYVQMYTEQVSKGGLPKDQKAVEIPVLSPISRALFGVPAVIRSGGDAQPGARLTIPQVLANAAYEVGRAVGLHTPGLDTPEEMAGDAPSNIA